MSLGLTIVFLHDKQMLTVKYSTQVRLHVCRYPTDNDKQMLATQTGLTRNQVDHLHLEIELTNCFCYLLFGL